MAHQKLVPIALGGISIPLGFRRVQTAIAQVESDIFSEVNIASLCDAVSGFALGRSETERTEVEAKSPQLLTPIYVQTILKRARELLPVIKWVVTGVSLLEFGLIGMIFTAEKLSLSREFDNVGFGLSIAIWSPLAWRLRKSALSLGALWITALASVIVLFAIQSLWASFAVAVLGSGVAYILRADA